MNISQIESNVDTLVSGISSGNIPIKHFLYELLLAYGHRKQSVTRLKSGERNLASRDNSAKDNEVIWKRHVYFKHVDGPELHSVIDLMRNEKLVTTNKIRFIIVTNFEQLLAVDTKTLATLDIELEQLPKQFDFFLPWSGMEKAVYQGENPADVKAAEKMAKLFDLIKGDNFDETNSNDTDALHNLNVFLTRLLFCFFAEDTGIFEDNQFSLAVKSHTHEDGSDLSDYLNRLFIVLNTAEPDRGPLPDYLVNFPYVNGGLFSDSITSPDFSRKSRRLLIECGGELDWSDINPDIFGSMIQAVVHPDQRGGMGMHYTSVTNIMKVIEPLFLNDLYEELEKIENSAVKLQKLQQRLSEIKIFDPACGSGNFLIIAYKAMRKLEMEVLKTLQELEFQTSGQISQPFSVILLSQFYGIEIDDFAHEVAILSLWLAEHQMNVEFKVEFGVSRPSLPLKKAGVVVCGNATRIEWSEVCPASNSGEVYVLGNPPYLGFKMQKKEQKEDIQHVFKGIENYKKLDYISCWVLKAAQYICNNKKALFSFVSTNSICQGEHVGLLWPHLFDLGLVINFAHTSFKWKNNARGNAGVICVIVGVGHKSLTRKYLFSENKRTEVEAINAYLRSGSGLLVLKQSSPISWLPKMSLGNMPKDDGNLILSDSEKDELIAEYPNSKKFIRKLIGAFEFIRGTVRWCIWIEERYLEEALNIAPINERIAKVKSFRANSTDKFANKMALTPYKFREQNVAENNSIIIPTVTSERRNYIPMGFLGKDVVIVAPNFALYDPPVEVFAVISSRMHMTWVRATAGRLKTDYRYSSVLCYNTFPIPIIDSNSRENLSRLVFSLLGEQQVYADKTIAKLYDPDYMPERLRLAHEKIDYAIEQCYRKKPFSNDDERLEYMFKLYEEMTGGHKDA